MKTLLTTDDTQPSYSQKDYDAAFAIAKEALTYVATFQTPPTPDVYEIWYRFAEGANPELTSQLAFAVNELKSVSRSRIEQLHQEYFARMESRGEDADLTNCLATELGGLESIIRTSITITDDFDAAVSAVGENLHNRADPEEIRGCVEAVLANSESIQSQLRELTSQLQESQANVEKLQAGFLESQKSLQTDPLTGVGNRRFFDLLMTQSIDAARTSQMSRILLLIDLDNFKHINDSYGHAAGDDVLRYVASKMQEIASDASIARYGGDEFAVFMNCEQPHDGLELANELHQCFVGKHLTKRGTGESLGNVTLSIGLALLRSEDTSESWFDRADKLLYSAKAGGRSCVMAERKLGLA